MPQVVYAALNGSTEKLSLPDSHAYVMDGVKWGYHYEVFTPAFWAALAWMESTEAEGQSLRIGKTLSEEVAACLLGGHGIPAEVGLAAFYRVRDAGLLDGSLPSEGVLYDALSEPLIIKGRKVRYRFARQRSAFLSEALNVLDNSAPPTESHLDFRDWMLGIKGIGPKTASWITRNWLDSDEVAIIDIHIYRAGLLMNLYDSSESPSTRYFLMERKFLSFAKRLGLRPSFLDALIWRQMKNAGSMALNVLRRVLK
jgi:N-glycosylase/DNA lyase